MRIFKGVLIGIILGGGIVLGVEESIRWKWNGATILVLHQGGATLELGLRNDGVVVWREMCFTTNSPAEKEDYSRLKIEHGGTNVWLYTPSIDWKGFAITNGIAPYKGQPLTNLWLEK